MGYSSPAIWPLVLWEQLVLLSSLGVTLYLQQVDCAALRDLFRTSFGPGVRAGLQAGSTKIIRWGPVAIGARQAGRKSKSQRPIACQVSLLVWFSG